MSGTGLLQLIRKHGLRVFTTADMLTLTAMAPAAATQALVRLAEQDLIVRIKRGVWVSRLSPDFHPYEAVPHLVAPWPAYVSLYSALADYGVVEEVPQVVYAVSPANPRRCRTPVGDFHIHHLPQRLIWGYEMRRMGHGSYPMAEPEKAFLDQVYLALVPRSPIGFPHKRNRRWKLDARRLKKYAARFRSHALTEWLTSQGMIPP